MWLEIAKLQAHACSWLDVNHCGFGFEVLIGMENFHEDRSKFREGSGGLEVTAMQADFGCANGDSCAQRALWSDLGGSIQRKSETAAVWVQGS